MCISSRCLYYPLIACLCVFLFACTVQRVTELPQALDQRYDMPTHSSRNRLRLKLITTYTVPETKPRLSFRFLFTPTYRIWTQGTSDKGSAELMYSDDFGQSWTYVNLPKANYLFIDSFTFVDHDRLWANDDSEILKTSDGGKTWIRVPLSKHLQMAEIDEIKFVDENHGFIGGSTSYISERGLGTISYGIKILCTKDSGRTWNICYVNKVTDRINRIFVLADTAYFLVDGNVLLVTNDHGVTWKKIPLDFAVIDIQPDADGVLWALCEDDLIRFSRDGGKSWETVRLELPIQKDFRWSSISFDKKGIGVAVGNNGVVVMTADAGRTWSLQTGLGLQGDLWGVSVQSPYVVVSDERSFYFLKIGD